MTLEPETRRRILIGAVGVVLLASAFAAGRFSGPAKVETREVFVERVDFKSLATEELTRDFKFTKVEERTVFKNVATTITVTDAGTTTTIVDNSVEHYGGLEDGQVTEQEARTEVVQVEREVIVEKTRTVTLQPDWRVAALAGAAWDIPLATPAPKLVVGGEIDRRILGGFSAGLWLNATIFVGPVSRLDALAGGGKVALDF